jgi:hypothetical protein
MVDYDDESISIFPERLKKITLALRQSGANLTHGKDYLMADMSTVYTGANRGVSRYLLKNKKRISE